MDLYEELNNDDIKKEKILYDSAFNDTFKKIYPIIISCKKDLPEDKAQYISQLTNIFFSELEKYIYKSYRTGFKDGATFHNNK